jgi:protein-tyrosine phosphatase
MRKISVMFVCTGNICRSPMAEAVFKNMLAQKGLSYRFLVASAATDSWHLGQPPHRGTLSELAKNKITLSGKISQKLTNQDINSFDYIVLMDNENVEDVKRYFGITLPKLLDYAPQSTTREVPDPYYKGNFSEVYQLVTQGCQGLLETIIKKEFQE